MKLKKKVRRYKHLFREIANWPQFLLFKIFSGKAFTFQLRQSLSVTVPKSMFSPFKEIFLDQVYLNEITKRRLTGGQMNIIDIGANVGFFSLFMLSRFPQARIYAFEPMPYNFGVMERYRRRYPQFHWKAVNKAVSDNERPLLLNASSIDSFTTMSSVRKSGKRNETIEVQSTTMEKIFGDFNLSFVDYLKLDCEGSEYAILYGAPKDVLKKINVISIEVHPGEKEDENLESLSAFLQKNGFEYSSQQEGNMGYIWAWRKGKINSRRTLEKL